MPTITDNELHLRLEVLMARRAATKALKFINTKQTKYSLEYELTGDL